VSEGVTHQIKTWETGWCKTWCGRYFVSLEPTWQGKDSFMARTRHKGKGVSEALTGYADFATCPECHQRMNSPALTYSILAKRKRAQ
jgi:hypothetical protein